MSNDKKIQEALFNARRESRKMRLSLLGIEIEKVEEIEKEEDSNFEKVAEMLQKSRQQEGEGRVERHNNSLEKSNTQISGDLQNAVHANLSTTTSIFDHLQIDRIDPSRITPNWWCHCHYYYHMWCNAAEVKEITVSESEPAKVDATVLEDSSCFENRKQPYVSVKGDPGSTNVGTIDTGYKFTFEPATDGTYCIRPITFMNGWWLCWAWGGCTGEDPGSSSAKVKLKVKVDQLSTTIKEMEHTILDETSGTGDPSKEGVIDYDSERDGGATMTVNLQGGYDAVISVTCVVEGEVVNRGRVIVDMQRSSNFYFRTPIVWAGKRHCHWPWIVVEPLKMESLPLPIPVPTTQGRQQQREE